MDEQVEQQPLVDKVLSSDICQPKRHAQRNDNHHYPLHYNPGVVCCSPGASRHSAGRRAILAPRVEIRFAENGERLPGPHRQD